MDKSEGNIRSFFNGFFDIEYFAGDLIIPASVAPSFIDKFSGFLLK